MSIWFGVVAGGAVLSVEIIGVQPGSVSEKAGIHAGDRLVSVNGHLIHDVLDYQFYTMEAKLKAVVSSEGKEHTLKIKKGEYEDLGLEFETYLMDRQAGCKNKCCFCFIDQLPKGMRKSLYFKDDDERLSFLFGNYITLTNLTEEHIERIVTMRISPVNISVHTTNPQLRIDMMKNPAAGEVLRYIPKLAENGIFMNCQLVLCPGINDGVELERTLEDLSQWMPQIQSVACVPVGLTKYREGLVPLRPYTQEEARDVLNIVNSYGDRFHKEFGERMVYPSDEFFLKADVPIPAPDYYGEFSQLENGVGMSALLKKEFIEALRTAPEPFSGKEISVATSVAAYPLIQSLVDEARKKWHNLVCNVYPITNDFFGCEITVSGLITGGNLYQQLKGRPLGTRLLIPANMLRKERDVFLDDVSLTQLQEQLGVVVIPVENDGYEFLDRLIQ